MEYFKLLPNSQWNYKHASQRCGIFTDRSHKDSFADKTRVSREFCLVCFKYSPCNSASLEDKGRGDLPADASVNLACVFVSPWRQCKHICFLFALVMEAFYTAFMITGNDNIILGQKQGEFFTTVTKANLVQLISINNQHHQKTRPVSVKSQLKAQGLCLLISEFNIQ